MSKERYEMIVQAAIREKKDPHTAWAAALFEVPYSEVTPKQRTFAKQDAHSYSYGDGVPYHLTPGASQGNAFTNHLRSGSLVTRKDIANATRSVQQSRVVDQSRSATGKLGRFDIRIRPAGSDVNDLR